MNKIFLDQTNKNDFLEYAMQRANNNYKGAYLLKYFTLDNVSKLYDYFANGKTYCNDKGEFWSRGDKEGFISSRVTFNQNYLNYKAGEILTSRNDILEYNQKSFENDYNSYREDNLFHWVWCNIEQILRCVFERLDDKDANRIFKKYCT